MPGNMNGRELAEKLWSERPGLKVIFSSGYSSDIVGKDFKLEPEVNFLQKPYHPQKLAHHRPPLSAKETAARINWGIENSVSAA